MTQVNIAKLKRSADAFKKREIRNVVRSVAQIGQRWRNPGDAIRREAAELLPAEFGMSPEGVNWGLELIFGDWTEDQLWDLLIDNLGNPRILDGFAHRDEHTVALARGPRILLQILAGNSPASMAHAILMGLLSKSAQIIKCPASQPSFPTLLRRSILEVDPEMADALAVGTWSTNRQDLLDLAKNADTIVVYGSDETVHQLRMEVSPAAHFIGFGHAVSAAIVTKEMVSDDTAERLVWDTLTYDQRGCLSPRVVLVESGGSRSPFEFAQRLAEHAIPQIAQRLPGGPNLAGEAEAILQRRGVYAFRGQVFSGDDWTVTYDEQPIWPTESLPRFLPVKPFNSLDELVQILKPAATSLMCVGIDVIDERRDEFARLLAPSSVSRICRIGVMQCPPLNWSVNGRSPLQSMLRLCRMEIDGLPGEVEM